MIYAIRAVGTQFIKVGKAGDVAKRLVGLETGCPHELKVEAIADWPDGAETLIHKLLGKHNVRNEWFSECDLLASIIEWMGNKDLGLARLHYEGIKAGFGEWREKPERTVEERIASVVSKRPMTKAEKRRSERQAWWQRRGLIHGKTHTKAATPRGNQAED